MHKIGLFQINQDYTVSSQRTQGYWQMSSDLRGPEGSLDPNHLTY